MTEAKALKMQVTGGGARGNTSTNNSAPNHPPLSTARASATTTRARQPPASTTSARQLGVRPISAIVGAIRHELGLLSSTTIPDTISQAMSTMELKLGGSISLKDKAIFVAKELNIPVTDLTETSET